MHQEISGYLLPAIMTKRKRRADPPWKKRCQELKCLCLFADPLHLSCLLHYDLTSATRSTKNGFTKVLHFQPILRVVKWVGLNGC